ncbi:MAG: asparagine synthase (glutamine-hydrolyzing) [Kiritimatiellae bacterium]|nr:asparagine synthase (glutamine-hydrolyzing) [Kiritimatiellia bacterium]
MCGISGIIDFDRCCSTEVLSTRITAMTRSLAHRGPDGTGFWLDEKEGIALGHNRLAILDLSDAGCQPMISADGRFVLVYNGEIYNCQVLRKELEAAGHTFRGHSDTEVLVEGISRWGMPHALDKFQGMFAFAVWDRRDRVLHLARDRIGIKPLYYGRAGHHFIFASELKAFRAHDGFHGEIDRSSLALYLRYGYLPSPYAIYMDTWKLPPGHFLTLSPHKENGIPASRAYWSVSGLLRRAANEPFEGTEDEALEALGTLLKETISAHMLSDVPLGAFLSGGIDSSTVVAFMQCLSRQPVKTFSIGFLEEGRNEADFAKAVASHLKTDHEDLYVPVERALDVVPRLGEIYDEPLADSSQIPTLIVSQLARRKVTVVLSGDGGDELFGGYDLYRLVERYAWLHHCLPGPARRLCGRWLKAIPTSTWDKLLFAPNLVLSGRTTRLSGRQFHALGSVLAMDRLEDVYRRLVAVWPEPELVLGDKAALQDPLCDWEGWPPAPTFLHWMQAFDMRGYLPDDILAKVDRASMSVGLEVRVPLLDHRVVEFCWSLPLSMKRKGGERKHLLRLLLYRYVPRALVDRPKKGFSVPLCEWLRRGLREWAEAMLSPQRLKDNGFFDTSVIRQKWEQHVRGGDDWSRFLWPVLVFQAWSLAASRSGSGKKGG